MRAAATDRRIMLPPAPQWELLGGAYREGEEIVLPEVGSFATAWLHLQGTTERIDHNPEMKTPPSDDPRYAPQAFYYAADRTTRVEASTGRTSDSYGTTLEAADEWARPTREIIFRTGPNVQWMLLRIGATATWGVPGTRLRISPNDLVVRVLPA